jgi:2-iminobutanoate/2-iminopropanoate deaminase
MSKVIVQTTKAPAAIGPYSQAIVANGVAYLSGQLGMDPATGQLVEGGFEAQVRQAFKNLEELTKASGSSLDQCLKLTLFLTDLAHFATVNQIMQERFSAPFPARSTIGVASLPRAALFEVEAIVLIPPPFSI